MKIERNINYEGKYYKETETMKGNRKKRKLIIHIHRRNRYSQVKWKKYGLKRYVLRTVTARNVKADEDSKSSNTAVQPAVFYFATMATLQRTFYKNLVTG